MSLLATRALAKSFGENRAVNNVDFTVRQGEVLSLIGSNGAGKTTLVNLVSGLYMPDSGQILFEGRDVTRQSSYGRIRAGIALFPEVELAVLYLIAAIVLLVRPAGLFGRGER